jgi:hypothetical protein
VPFVYLGYPGAALRNAYGLATAYDGFLSRLFLPRRRAGGPPARLGRSPRARSVLEKAVSPLGRLATSAGIGLGSFLAWYLTYHAIYTHAATFLLVGVFLLRWGELEDDIRDYVVLGLLLGLAPAVRWQNAVFCLLPGWRLLRGAPLRLPALHTRTRPRGRDRENG